ncbi:MAG: hypothetical protein PHD13_07120 [Methanocellales archaeon]|nr:hypothetical protein [Methanocellales archaeon]MDD3291539.1 hypothetical protein [Methanocellales archaeon]MDD5235929.1 hypothetical protein [Methanocellales archaeon]
MKLPGGKFAIGLTGLPHFLIFFGVPFLGVQSQLDRTHHIVTKFSLLVIHIPDD